MTKLSEIRDKFGEHQNLSNLQQQTLGSAKTRKNNLHGSIHFVCVECRVHLRHELPTVVPRGHLSPG